MAGVSFSGRASAMPNSFGDALQVAVSRFLFPLSLVTFEFAVYVSNDMIMPGMPKVIEEFHASPDMTSLALTAAMLGNASLQWLLGPLSDRYGRRPVLLAGLAMFIVSTLAMWPVSSMAGFILLRFLQGMGCCFVLTVGYPTVQEAFEEKTAVRVTALMANVSLLAPLLGPVAGAVIVTYWPWRVIFLLIAVLGMLAFVGLHRTMPELHAPRRGGLTPRALWQAYRVTLRSARLWLGSVMLGLAIAPLLTWIAVGPIVLIERAGLSQMQYGVLQIPVFGMLIAGNLILARQVGRWSYAALTRAGVCAIVAGALLNLVGLVATDGGYPVLLVATALHALGLGMFYGVVYRQTLFAVEGTNRATVAGGMSMICIVVAVGTIELAKMLYLVWGDAALALMAVAVALCLAFGTARFMRGMAELAAGPAH